LLQILSNLANDYGDAVKGSDKPDRIGRCADAERGDYPGADETRADRHRGADLSLWPGAAVLPGRPWRFHRLPGAGGLSIVAAITYTVGTRPYGYIGLGDISVLVFFGWLSVLGSWYLQAHVEAAIFCRPPPAVCWRPRC
jgi:1,4-dihydroxy-2-naphthoate octaprenyltransferase